MKTNKILVLIATIFIGLASNAQQSIQDKVEKLAQDLNAKMASNFQMKIENKKAICSYGKIIVETLDLRDRSEITKDTLPKGSKTFFNNDKRFSAPIYWKYNFSTASSTKVVFKANKYQQLFCTFYFQEKDTISIRSGKNRHTCVTRVSDVKPHTVHWVGDKYISLLLTPNWVGNKISFKVNGITLSGKFQRNDRYEFSKTYTSTLKLRFRREFEKLFESENLTNLLQTLKI